VNLTHFEISKTYSTLQNTEQKNRKIEQSLFISWTVASLRHFWGQVELPTHSPEVTRIYAQNMS
jgi:hypothetical protein